nr:PREDICTED: protein D3-like [Bemisia tabaci]
MHITFCVIILFQIILLNFHVLAAPKTARTPRPPKKSPAKIKERLLKFNIIPDIIPSVGCPRHEIQVVWPKARAELGNPIPSVYTMTQPEVSWPARQGQYYTLLMVDPDRDKGTKFKDHEFQCWLIGNIPGGNVSAGKKLTDYIPPIKPKSLDHHRFVFFIFKHANKTTLTYDEPRLISE